jgi:hypothetical protein
MPSSFAAWAATPSDCTIASCKAPRITCSSVRSALLYIKSIPPKYALLMNDI